MKTKQRFTIAVALLISNLAFTFCWLSGAEAKAQNIGINGSGANAHASALLDVDAASTPSLGILIPRIALQAINLAAPVTSPATSLLVYNTASASTGTNAVSAGYYYWDGTKWVRFAYSASGSSANDWNILGNAGTNSATHFLGTTDNQDLVFKRNNVKAGLLNNALFNTAFGVSSLLSSTGGANVAVGHSAMQNNTTGGNNVAVGANSMLNNTTGYQNVAVGPNTLRSNTIGTENTAVGSSAMLSNISGTANVAMGNGAVYLNTTGYNNTGIGFVSLYSNTSGVSNSGNGIATLFSNTTGSHNSAHGADVLHSNTTGNFNTASGSSTMYSNITGSANVATGYQALPTNTTGVNNVAIGYRSIYVNLSGSNNTASGFESLFNTQGNNNTSLGYSSGYTNNTGFNNTFIGANADATGGTFTNATAIGYNAKIGQSNALILGGTGADAVNVGIGTTTPARFFHSKSTTNTNGLFEFVNASTSISNGYGLMIQNNDQTNGNYASIMFGGHASSTGTGWAGIASKITDRTVGSEDADIAFWTKDAGASSEKVVIKNNGNVGINTTNPTEKLEVAGKTLLTNGFSTTNAALIYKNTSDYLFLGPQSGSTTHGATIGLFGASNNEAASPNPGGIDLSVIGSSPALRVLSSGNVGIGTTAPTEKLDISGSVKIVDGTQGLNKVLTSDATGKAHWQESAVTTNKLSFSLTYPASIPAPATGNLSAIGAPFTIATTGIYRVLVDATIPSGMILGIDNQSLANSVLYSTVTNRYYAQYFVYMTAGTHSLIYYNDANGALLNGGPYWQFQIEGPIN